MNVKITYYLDTTTSGCYWAEPAWAKLKHRYANSPVESLLVDASAYAFWKAHFGDPPPA